MRERQHTKPDTECMTPKQVALQVKTPGFRHIDELSRFLIEQVLLATGLSEGRQQVALEACTSVVSAILEREMAALRRLDLAEMQEIQAKAAYASKMASLGEMAGGLAHEINNPLTIIRGSTELVRLGVKKSVRGALDPELEAQLCKIESTTDRIALIVKGLRNFARESTAEMLQTMKLGVVIEDTISFCGERFQAHGVQLAIDWDSFQHVLPCRPIQLSQVLVNLLNNAFDAVMAKGGGQVRVSAQEMRLAIVPETNPEPVVVIRVSDNGIGVPADLREKIMQPFFTTKEIGTGTGLGLSISRGLMQAAGGTLRLAAPADSEFPGGATFEVLLPKK